MAKPQKFREEAQQFFEKGKWDKALESYQKLIKVEPQDPKIYQKIAELQLKLNQKKEAVVTYKQAVDKFMAKGFLIQAIAICKIIIQLAPEEKEIEERLATLYAKRSTGPEAGAPQPSQPLRRPTEPPASPRPQAASTPVARIKPEPRPQPMPARPQPGVPQQKASPKQEKAPIAMEPIQVEESDTELSIERTSYESEGEASTEKSAAKTYEIDTDALPEAAKGKGAKAKPKTEKSVPVYELSDEPMEIETSQAGQEEMPPPAQVKGGITLEEEAPAEIERTSQMETPSATKIEGGVKLEEDVPAEIERTAQREAPASAKPEAGIKLEEGAPIDIGLDMGESDQPPPSAPPEESISIDAAGSDDGIEIDVMGDDAGATQESEKEQVEIGVGDSKEPSAAPVFDLSEEMKSDEDVSKVMEEEAEPTPIIESDIEEATFFPEIPLFSDLNQDEFKEVVAKLRSRSFKKGDVVIREGEQGDSIFIVGNGRIEVYKEVKDRGRVLLGTLSEGEFFGEFGYFAGSKRQASATAAEDTDLLEIARPDMEEVVKRFPGVEDVLEKFYRARVIENLMATSSLFSELKAVQRAKVASIFRLEEIREGTEIVKEGAEGDKMYLIRSGNVTVHAQNPMGEKVTLAELVPGDFFGEISLLMGKPRTATVTANSPVVELMSLKKEDLDTLIEQFPSIGERLHKVMEARTEDTVNKVSFLDLDEEALEIGSLI